MATYYVRLGGIGNGTGPAISQAWGTIAQALAASGGMSSGDTVYIAPGNYNEQLTVNFTSPTAATYIIGDPTASQFTEMAAGYVRITAYPTNQASAANITGVLFSATTKNYLNIKNIHFESNSSTSGVDILTSQYTVIEKCSFVNHDGSGRALTLSKTSGTSTPINATITQCTFMTMKGTSVTGVYITGSASVNMSLNVTFTDCLFLSSGQGVNVQGSGSGDYNGGVSYYNCTFLAGVVSIYNTNGGGSTSFPHIVKNCLLHSPTGINNQNGLTASYQITYTRILATTNVSILTNGTGTSTTGALGLETGYALINGIQTSPLLSSVASSPNQNFGNATSAPTTDIYSVAWNGTSPDAGASTYVNVSSITSYIPTDRNASTITIAPGSTSQSIELYLGATGLTASTSGLSARYNRSRTASVAITLVARTIAQAWTAGGFAEVDATNMPGVYRLDLPDAALAVGASDVTIVVRGASGTNGAVLTVTLSSGGLTAAQTASAVWDATASAYNTAGSMGEAGQKLTGYSLASSQTFSTTGAVGSVTGAVTVGTNNDKTGYALSTAANTTAADAVWNSTRSGHTTAGTFGQYVNAELVTPVTQSALVRMGPYQVIADGVATPMPMDIQKGAQHGVDIQCVDNNLSAIDITGATITAKVYNSGGTLVDTYSCTATYAADGRASFTIDTTVTNTPGTYTATITRTTGASDTQIFGPLRIYVRDI